MCTRWYYATHSTILYRVLGVRYLTKSLNINDLNGKEKLKFFFRVCEISAYISVAFAGCGMFSPSANTTNHHSPAAKPCRQTQSGGGCTVLLMIDSERERSALLQ